MDKLEYKLIKNKYGEQMAHYCKSNFPTILEREGVLINLLTEHFGESKLLYDDLLMNKKFNEFNVYIYSLFYRDINYIDSTKSVKELMDEAGYILYKCETNEDIDKFKKYYAVGEHICTFRKNRTKTHHVFFAIKKNVDEIKREEIPTRDGLYGTSVISLQFQKGDVNILSIKNRYNDTVLDADNTFDSNLERIKPGLTKSFERDYGLNIRENSVSQFDLLNYKKANNNKFYKYNMCINNICYGPNNIIIDNGNVINKYQEKEKFIVMDYFILDLENKTIKLYDDSIQDSFLDEFKNITKITVTKDKQNNRKISIELENNKQMELIIDKTNQIVSYTNNNIYEIKDNFLLYNMELNNLIIPNVESIGNNFLYYNYNMEELYLNKLKVCKDYFMPNNIYVKLLYAPQLQNIGTFFMRNAYLSIEEAYLDNLKYLSYGSFGNEMTIEELKDVNKKENTNNFPKSPLVLRKIS